MKKKLWAGRFVKETHHEVENYTASIEFDFQLAYEDILGSLAHVDMLFHFELINTEERNKLQQGLQALAKKIADGEVDFCIEDEDIHMNIERLLGNIIGETAGKLHTARSRNDQVALDMHLYLRKQSLFVAEQLLQLQASLFDLANKHTDVILPGYTHLQRAQPIFLAKHWLAYAAMFQRDFLRLKDSWARINQSPLGACALTGSSFCIDRHYVSSLLSFNGIYENTLDAVSDRDFVLEFLSFASLCMMHISRLSEELILWSSQEFGFISFDDAFSTGSSIMSQKKNPDVAELGRGKTGRVYGHLFSLLTVLKGLPLAYNKDLQEDKEPLFDTVKTLQQTLSIYSQLLLNLTINTNNMRLASENGYLNATVLAEYLVKKGLSFRSAHETVGRMVAFCIEKKCQLENLSLTEMQRFTPLIDDNVYAALSIQYAASACDQGWLDRELNQCHQAILLNRKWLVEKYNLLAEVYQQYQIPFSGFDMTNLT